MTRRSLTAILAVGLLFLALSLMPQSLLAATGSRNSSSPPEPITVQPERTISLTTDADTDKAIQKRIEGIIANLEGYDNITIKVDAGVVTMDGVVLNRQSQDRLEALVVRVDGVAEIQDNIRQNNDIQQRFATVKEHLIDRIRHALGFIPLILVALASASVVAWVGNRLSRMHGMINHIAPNPFIAEILATCIKFSFWIAAVVVGLDVLGATALLSTFLGAAGIMGIAVGFAVRDSVENFIASILLSMRQPFRPDDLVEIEGNSGHVLQLTSRATTLLSHDGNHIRIPNATVFKAVITNYTRNPERRFTFDLAVDPDADLKEVRDLALETLRGLDFVLPSPKPAVWVHEIGDDRIRIRVSAWVTQQGSAFHKARGEAIRVINEAISKAGFAVADSVERIQLEDIRRDHSGRSRPESASAQDNLDAGPDPAYQHMIKSSKEKADGDMPDLLSPDAPHE